MWDLMAPLLGIADLPAAWRGWGARVEWRGRARDITLQDYCQQHLSVVHRRVHGVPGVHAAAARG